MPHFKSHAADNDQNNSISQYGEGRKMDAHHGYSQMQKAQNSAVTSDSLIIQNQEPEKLESSCFYSIPNPTDTIRTMHGGEAYQGNVTFIHF